MDKGTREEGKRPKLLLGKNSVSRVITIHTLLTPNLYSQPKPPAEFPDSLYHLLLGGYRQLKFSMSKMNCYFPHKPARPSVLYQ